MLWESPRGHGGPRAVEECGSLALAILCPRLLGREGHPYGPLPCLFITSRPLTCCFIYLSLQYFLKHCVLMVVDLGKPWETVRDREAWRAAVYRVAKSRRRLSAEHAGAGESKPAPLFLQCCFPRLRISL